MRGRHFSAILLFIAATAPLLSQTLSGRVLEITAKGDTAALPGASLYWAHTTSGTASDAQGRYTLKKIPGHNRLVVSYIGYSSDTVTIDTLQQHADLTLSQARQLSEVVVQYRSAGSEFSYMNPLKVETLGERELGKAACCNLSESFETNPSVDVSFADAATGTKQIQLLGLGGQYALITKENMPYLRGLASMYGLSFIPGPWIQSIQLSKGAGSVINGYESFTGQINTELQNPETADRLFFNTYVDASARNEYSLDLSKKLGNVWSAALLTHYNLNPLKQDMNGDGFTDIPTGRQYNIMPRLNYETEKGFEGQLGGSFVNDARQGGQMKFSPLVERSAQPYYGIGINSGKWEVFSKNGFVFRNKPETSMGLQLSFLQHRQDNFYGLNTYKGFQQTFYANYIFQGILGTTDHKYKAGASYMWDEVNERYLQYNFNRIESVPGVFAEYTYTRDTNFNVVAGLRADYHNYYGVFLTPRLHIRYAFNHNNTVLRASAGRALKTANIFTDNASFMVSSRTFIIIPSHNGMPYGLDPETAWNYGINLLHKFKLNYRDAQFSLDVYRTDFINQVVADVDYNPQQVLLYNLKGRSFSNTAQAELSWEVRKRLNVRLAYRYVDTRTQYMSGLLPKYLLSKHRAFINASYETKDQHWVIDATAHWNSRKRLPETNANPPGYRRSSYSPDYFSMNAQLTYKTGTLKKLEIYAGAENLFDVKQADPIVSADNPFGPYFDASMVWGPVYGRMVYAGVRYKIK